VENTVAKRAMAVKPGLIRIEEVIYIKIQKAYIKYIVTGNLRGNCWGVHNRWKKIPL
jgi:hypothetical protein